MFLRYMYVGHNCLFISEWHGTLVTSAFGIGLSVECLIKTAAQISLWCLFQSFDEKVVNVTLAFELMQDAGLPKPKARPEDIVNLDLKSTLRVLYNLFTKYKHLN